MDEATPSFQERQALTTLTAWERNLSVFFRWLPYATLAIPLALAQFTTQAPIDRFWGITLVVAAAVWTWLMFTRLGMPFRVAQPSLRLYFAGFLIISVLLVLNNVIFLVYALTGLFHASLLRPWPLALAALTGASAVLHAHIVITESTPTTWAIYAGVVAIQAGAVGAGLIAGQKITEIAEERRLALEQLRTTLEENEGLHRQLIAQAREAGVLDERQRMAREIHDTIAQGLTGVITQLEAAGQLWADEARARRHLDTASGIARQSLAEARRSVAAVRPAPLDGSRLPEALGDVASKWSEVAGVPVDVRITGNRRPLRTEVEVVLLRAAQEGLTNIAKHAGASRAGLTLSFMEDSVVLDIRDNGVGMDPAASVKDGSFGLTGMRQRVANVRGEMQLESSPGDGTALAVRIPTRVESSDA